MTVYRENEAKLHAFLTSAQLHAAAALISEYEIPLTIIIRGWVSFKGRLGKNFCL
jgi:hypothetical protein